VCLLALIRTTLLALLLLVGLAYDGLTLFLGSWEWPNHVLDVPQDAFARHLVFLKKRLELAALDPGVLQPLLRRQPLLWVNNQAFLNKVDKVIIAFLEERRSNRVTTVGQTERHTAFLGRNEPHLGVEEIFSLLSALDHLFRRHSDSNPHQLEQLVLVNGREKGPSSHKLSKDAAEGPHVHRLVVRQPQDDLRAAIEAALHIDEPALRVDTRRAKVDYFDGCAC